MTFVSLDRFPHWEDLLNFPHSSAEKVQIDLCRVPDPRSSLHFYFCKTKKAFLVLEDPYLLTFERYDSALGWFEKKGFNICTENHWKKSGSPSTAVSVDFLMTTFRLVSSSFNLCLPLAPPCT